MTNEEQLLLQLLQAEPEPDKDNLLGDLASQVTDWQLFLQLCQRHGLLTIVSRRISQLSPDPFPDSFRNTSHLLSLQNAAGSMSLTRGLIQVLDLFSRNSITTLPFKGPLLAQQLYGDIGQRIFGDIDLLVSKEELTQAITLLEGIGFVAEIDDLHEKIAVFSRQEDNLALVRKEDNCLVELHWDISGCYLANPLPIETFPATASLSLAGRTVHSLTAEDLLVYLCVHGAKHMWERLEWLYSVRVLLEKHPDLDWDFIWKRSEEWQCRRMVLLGLQLSSELLAVCLPEGVEQRLIRDRVIPTLVSQVRQVLFPARSMPNGEKKERRFSPFHLLVRDTLSDRLTYGLRLLFRPTVKEWQTWPLPASSLAVLYYFYRPLRLMWEWARR